MKSLANRKGERSKDEGLTRLAEARLRQELRGHAPSEPWVDAQFVTIFARDERGRPIVRRLHDASVFPPGGEKTAMVRCPGCNVFTPPCAFEKGFCLDHADHGCWGPSPSAQAIAALQYRNLRLMESELPSESRRALQREIRLQTRNSAKTG